MLARAALSGCGFVLFIALGLIVQSSCSAITALIRPASPALPIDHGEKQQHTENDDADDRHDRD